MATLEDLVSATAKATKRRRTVTDEVARAFLRQVQAALAKDGEVHLFGFGRFTVKTMAARPVRDFATGEVTGTSEPTTRVWFQPYGHTSRVIRKGGAAKR